MTTKWWKTGLVVLAALLLAGVPAAQGVSASFVGGSDGVDQAPDGSVTLEAGQCATFKFTNTDGVVPITDNGESVFRLRIYMQATTTSGDDISDTGIRLGPGAVGAEDPMWWLGFQGAVGYADPIGDYAPNPAFSGDGLTDSWFQFSVQVGNSGPLDALLPDKYRRGVHQLRQ